MLDTIWVCFCGDQHRANSIPTAPLPHAGFGDCATEDQVGEKTDCVALRQGTSDFMDIPGRGKNWALYAVNMSSVDQRAMSSVGRLP